MSTSEFTVQSQEIAPVAAMPVSRQLYWSIRRELWENRSIYVAPLIVAAIVLFGVLISSGGLPKKIRGLSALEPAKQIETVLGPYSMAASVILLSGWIIGFFYCLDALNGERRDRSILFWKSMPVSDRTTVLAKAGIPLLVQPLLGCAIAFLVQWIILVQNTIVLIGSGLNPALVWAKVPLMRMAPTMVYGMAIHALWFAPIFAWLLLVSAWARRAVVLWAMLPFFAIMLIERMAFGTKYFANMIGYRLMGAMKEGFSADAMKTPIIHFSQLDPWSFLTSPGLWVGLAFAAACLAAAVRLRRNREPM